MVRKKGFTLIELITVIVILSIISAGSFMAINKIYSSYNRSKTVVSLLNESEIITQQIKNLLSNRVPSSAVGYDPKTGNFESIYNLTKEYKVFEWLSIASESFLKGEYSSFIDMKSCDPNSNMIVSVDTNLSLVNKTEQEKFELQGDLFQKEDLALIFSESYDEGGDVYDNNFTNFYGWHSKGSNKIFRIKKATQNKIFNLKSHPFSIYEKYFLIDSAYTIARGEDIDPNAQCIKDLPLKTTKETLFLFYNFRPWKKESFCADPKSGNKSGNVTIYSLNAKGFEILLRNDNLILNLTLAKRSKSGDEIKISTQKVIF